MEFNMKIVDGYDYILEEKGNSFIALRKLKWNEKSEARLDIRKYMIDSDGNEVTGKGIGFLSKTAPNELIKVLVETGYGDTLQILNGIKDRDDFMSNLSKVLNKEDMYTISDNNSDIEFNTTEEEEEIFYDPRELVNC